MSEIKQGYKQTKVGIIPEDWEIVKLGKLTTVETGKTPLRSNKQFWDNGTINWATTTEVNETYIVSTNEKITNQAVAELKMKILPINTILLAMYGQGKTRGKVALLRIESTINQAFASIKPNKNYSTNFVFNYLDKSYEKIRDLSHGSNQDNLNLDIVKALQVPLPPLKEQEKIAEILTTWDEAITKQTELLEAKELLKIALMQKLLSGEVRFDGFDDEWEEVRLGEIVKKMQSGGTPKADNQEFYNGNIPFVKVNDITSSGKYLIKTESSITEKGLKNSSAWIVPINSIIYSMYASVGFLSINTIEVATSQAMINIILDLEKANLEYIYYHLLDFKKNVHTYVETGTQGNLNAQTVRNLKIKLPSLPEQQKIAEVLSLADDEINLLKTELEELNLQKKALMQKLLTGQVRVKV